MSEDLDLFCECNSMECHLKLRFDLDEVLALRDHYPPPRYSLVSPEHLAETEEVLVASGVSHFGSRYAVVRS